MSLAASPGSSARDVVVFLGQAGDAGREAGRDDILAVSPSVPRWTRVAHGGQGLVEFFSLGAVLGGVEGDREVGRSFICTHSGEGRCVENWSRLMGPKSIFERPWGQG